jgi:hypothetical protein
MASPRSFDQGIRIARHLITLPWLPVDPDLNIGLPTLYDEPKPLCRPSGKGKQPPAQKKALAGSRASIFCVAGMID